MIFYVKYIRICFILFLGVCFVEQDNCVRDCSYDVDDVMDCGKENTWP